MEKKEATIEDVLELLSKRDKASNISTWLQGGFLLVATIWLGASTSFQVDISKKVAVLESNQINKTTIPAFKKEVRGMISGFLTVTTYYEIEDQKTDNLLDFIIDINKDAYLREEDVDAAKVYCKKKMLGKIKLGTMRGKL